MGLQKELGDVFQEEYSDFMTEVPGEKLREAFDELLKGSSTKINRNSRRGELDETSEEDV